MCISCSQWRHLKDIQDPSTIPRIWNCSDSKDPNYNECSISEEEYDEDEFYATNITYVPGSIVWYESSISLLPWPAMIDLDPESSEFLENRDKKTM